MNVKSDYLKKLNLEQEKSLNQCLDRIKQWTNFQDDYLALEKRLKTLADKLEYDIMVPFGSVAFMPGKLVRTNEIMVLLGENWFVERSTKQACEIVQRRVSQCDATLQKLRLEKQQLENWKQHTAEVGKEMRGDYVEIIEECDEDEERAWRERHKNNVRTYHQERNANKNVGDAVEADDGTSQEVLLQTEQEAESELSSEDLDSERDSGSSLDDDNADNELLEKSHKKVRWKDDTTDRNRSLQVTFTDTQRLHHEAPDGHSIQSPSDIYKHFTMACQSNPPKSILKHAEVKVQSTETDVAERTIKETKAFSNVVLERSGTSVTEPKHETSRKMSKFKTQRLVKKN